jgi:hypothetical protein
MTEWTEVTNEVLDIAKEIIDLYHPFLKEARIGFVFRDTTGTSSGKEVVAKTSKVPEKYKPYMDLDFFIWIAEDFWTDLSLERCQALIDHELCHCGLGDNGWIMIGHDVEEFGVILERYGLWNRDLFNAGKAMQKAANQLSFWEVSKPETGIFKRDEKGEVIAIHPEKIPEDMSKTHDN